MGLGFGEHKCLKEPGHWEVRGPRAADYSGGLAVVQSGCWLLRALWHLLGVNVVAPFLLFSPKFSWRAGAQGLGCPWQMAQGLLLQVPLTGRLGLFTQLGYPWHKWDFSCSQSAGMEGTGY